MFVFVLTLACAVRAQDFGARTEGGLCWCDVQGAELWARGICLVFFCSAPFPQASLAGLPEANNSLGRDHAPWGPLAARFEP